jgi:hypothetical protein
MSVPTLDVSTFLVGKLRQELQKLNLSAQGVKHVLVTRLRAANDANSSTAEVTAEERARNIEELRLETESMEELRLETESREKAASETLGETGNNDTIPKRRKIIRDVDIVHVFTEKSEVLQTLLDFSVAVGDDVWFDEISQTSTKIAAVASDVMVVGDSLQVVEAGPDAGEIEDVGCQKLFSTSHHFIFKIVGNKEDGTMMLSYVGGTAVEMADKLFIAPVRCPPSYIVNFQASLPTLCREIIGDYNVPLYKAGVKVVFEEAGGQRRRNGAGALQRSMAGDGSTIGGESNFVHDFYGGNVKTPPSSLGDNKGERVNGRES